MRIRSAVWGIIFLGWMILSSTLSISTTFVERPFPETVLGATNIVRGRVGMSYSDWDRGEDGSRRIYTLYDLQIEEVFKGSVEEGSLIMRELGGEKDGISMHVAGAAEFERGEDVVVMLGGRNSNGTYDIRGLMMGKYNVERDENGEDYLNGAGISSTLLPVLRGHEHLLNPSDKQGQADTASGKKWSLDALRQLVRSQAAKMENSIKRRDFKSEARASNSVGMGQMTPAPQLHTSSAGVSKAPVRLLGLSWAFLVGGAGSGLLGWLLVRSRKRKQP